MCPGATVPTLADIYEEHAEECLRAAGKTDNPKYRDKLLKLASAWREDAETLKRGEELLNPASAWRKKALKRVAEGAPSDAAPASARRMNGSDVRRIVRATGDAKDHEGVNSTFVPTYQDDTTFAAFKFDRRIGHLQRWRRPGHHPFNERRRNDLERPLWGSGHCCNQFQIRNSK
jgi:hypothetical protein